MLTRGTQLGHYRILDLLKRGGMAEVYRAEDIRLPRQVAIKVVQSEPLLYPNVAASQEAMRLFQREMEAVARLDHPHILPLIDFGNQISDGSELTYMVMPLRLEGSLSDWLRRRGMSDPLAPHEVGSLIRQAASALSYAHTHGFVHQDVKPSNFLIRERDGQSRSPDLLLTDFGVAKMTETSKSSTNVRGTLQYMAPEQLNGHAIPASDQYALAIMAYELLTGQVPFSGTPTQVIFQHTQVMPAPPSTVNPRVSKLLDGVLLQALTKDPHKRFPSVNAFAEAFDLALQGKQANGYPEEKTRYSPPAASDDLHYKKTVLAFDHRDSQQEHIPFPPNSAPRTPQLPPVAFPPSLTAASPTPSQTKPFKQNLPSSLRREDSQVDIPTQIVWTSKRVAPQEPPERLPPLPAQVLPAPMPGQPRWWLVALPLVLVALVIGGGAVAVGKSWFGGNPSPTASVPVPLASHPTAPPPPTPTASARRHPAAPPPPTPTASARRHPATPPAPAPTTPPAPAPTTPPAPPPTPTPTPLPPTPTLTVIWNSNLDSTTTSLFYNNYHATNGYYYVIVTMTFKNVSPQSQVLKGSMLVLQDSAGNSYAEDQVADRQQVYEVASGGSITAQFAFIIPTYACKLTLDFNDPLGKTFYWNFREYGSTCSV